MKTILQYILGVPAMEKQTTVVAVYIRKITKLVLLLDELHFPMTNLAASTGTINIYLLENRGKKPSLIVIE